MKLVRWISDLWHLGPRVRIALIAGPGLFLITLLYPIQTTVVPEWNLRVVDDAGEPVRDLNVTEHWQHYALESSGHEEMQKTSQEGRASFGRRSIRASLVRRLLDRITGSSDRRRIVPYGAVVVWGSRDHETNVAVYRGEEPPATEIRVRRSR